MATALVNIESIEWSNNPVTIGQATLIKISVSKITTDTISCSENVMSGQYSCGQQVNNISILEP